MLGSIDRHTKENFMKKRIQKSAVAAAAVAALSAGTAMSTAPAHAGGPGTTYAKGDTKTQCEAVLSAKMGADRAAGATITGVHHCYRVDEDWVGKRWLGNYVANF
jgi:hypothetical protein